jgi:WD40 repeat protein
VTALSFLSTPGREHLLLTGSEASTTLKLWDMRNRYSRNATPLSTTAQPESHSRHRHFGVNSIVLGGPHESRIYALSRDNTVYAYSTAHLILGHAPEMSDSFAQKHTRSMCDDRKGLGPIYGFRHQNLHATSFYVKAALRKAKDDRPEMLAVGSSEGCPILFPTDEPFLSRRQPTHIPESEDDFSDDDEPVLSPLLSSSLYRCTPPTSSPPKRPGILRKQTSTMSLSTRMKDTIPIFDSVGTALVGGHSKEVTGLTWTHGGELVTLSDDYTARCWREGPMAREARRWNRFERQGWGLAEFEDDEGWDGDD